MNFISLRFDFVTSCFMSFHTYSIGFISQLYGGNLVTDHEIIRIKGSLVVIDKGQVDTCYFFNSNTKGKSRNNNMDDKMTDCCKSWENTIRKLRLCLPYLSLISHT